MRIILLIALIISSYLLVYMEGLKAGADTYKRSNQFQMTLDAAYRFGYMDCKGGK
jgi:hypothetical protein